MGHKDELSHQLLKERAKALKAIANIPREMLGETVFKVNKSVTETFAKSVLGEVATIHRGALNFSGQQAYATVLEIFKNIHIPNYKQIFNGLVVNAGMFQFNANQMVADMVKSMGIPPIDLTVGVAALFRDFDTKNIAGNSVSTAIAAITAVEEGRFENIRESFAREVAEALKVGFGNIAGEDKEAFARFEKVVSEKIASLPPSQVSAESLWKFLVTLFLMLSTWGITTTIQIKNDSDSSKNDAKYHAEMMAVWERLAEQLRRLFPETDNNTYYVAVRRTELKVKPNFDSYTITVIFPNQKVRLVRINHQWIYIEYFDYLEGVPKCGWASKKYLKRLAK